MAENKKTHNMNCEFRSERERIRTFDRPDYNRDALSYIISLLKYIKTKKLTIEIVSLEVSAKGFEPLTVCLEGRCSIQLSYAPIKS